MTRFSGLVGYVTQVQTAPGVWSQSEESFEMRGDIINQGHSFQGDTKVNSDVSLNHRVSLMADDRLLNNYPNLKWVKMGAVKWKVQSVEIRRPRIIVTLGGVYNGK